MTSLKFRAGAGIKNAQWWIAGNDLAEEGVFYWEFRQRKVYTNWDDGQPDNYRGNEHCSMIWHRNGRFRWNDGPCTDRNFFICEYYVNSRHMKVTLDEGQAEIPFLLD